MVVTAASQYKTSLDPMPSRSNTGINSEISARIDNMIQVRGRRKIFIFSFNIRLPKLPNASTPSDLQELFFQGVSHVTNTVYLKPFANQLGIDIRNLLTRHPHHQYIALYDSTLNQIRKHDLHHSAQKQLRLMHPNLLQPEGFLHRSTCHSG